MISPHHLCCQVLPTILPALTIWVSLCLPGFSRTFKDTQGREIEAELVAHSGETITILTGGKEFPLPINKFSVDDQIYIRDWIEANPTKLKTDFAYFVELEKAGNASSIKVDYDERLGKIPMNYSISITNRSPGALTDLRVDYQIFVSDFVRSDYRSLAVEGEQRLAKVQRITGKTEVDRLEQDKRVDIEKPFEIQKYVDRDGGKVDFAKTDKVLGIWLRVYAGETLLDEYKREAESKGLYNLTWEAPN